MLKFINILYNKFSGVVYNFRKLSKLREERRANERKPN